MKISLNADTISVLKAFKKRVLVENEFVEKSTNALVNALILEVANSDLSKSQVRAVSARLQSDRSRKRAILQEVSKLARSANTEALVTLEKQLRKLRDQGESQPEAGAPA